jgi:hypothetical protein
VMSQNGGNFDKMMAAVGTTSPLEGGGGVGRTMHSGHSS